LEIEGLFTGLEAIVETQDGSQDNDGIWGRSKLLAELRSEPALDLDQ
jgi:hypothetical protein